MARHRLSRGVSRRMFSRTASYVKSLNLRAVPMRGGFRL